MATIDVGEFLEHYGVRGMKWGVRAQKAKTARTPAKPLTRKQKQDRNVKIVRSGIRIAYGAAFIAAVIFAKNAEKSQITRDNKNLVLKNKKGGPGLEFKSQGTKEGTARYNQVVKDMKFNTAVDTYMKSREATWSQHNASMLKLDKVIKP